jgi:hypothetical protein
MSVRQRWCVVLGVLGLVWAGSARGQLGMGSADPLVELPPLLVEGSRRLPPWLYANVDGVEYLSRCTTTTTRGYIERRVAQLRVLRWLIPPEFMPRMDVPSVTVLYSQRLRARDQEHMVKELMELRQRRGGGILRNSRVGSVPNLMLEDRDFFGVFAYIDEDNFKPAGLTVATDYVDFLLERRVPALPEWLRTGLTGIYSHVKIDRRVNIDPLIWLSLAESSALGANPHWPRTLVFAHDFFSPTVWREEPLVSVKGRTLRAQSTLFVRWALDPRHGVRDAFWRFAAAAIERPVTDEMFEEFFGFGFSDWRDRLSDYLPEAVTEPLVITPPRLPGAPRVRVREANPGEVARLKGEWERLSIGFVQKRYPEFAERYVDQARETLTRSLVAGDRSPELHAALGLCEIDAGQPAAAREHLEKAVDGGVVRPRVYGELARLRRDEIALRRGEAAGRWSASEIDAVMTPLRVAFAQQPPLPETYRLAAEVWVLAGDEPPPEAWRVLEEGSAYFPEDVRLAYAVAEALAAHGRDDRAVEVLGKAFGHVRDDGTRARFAELYARLSKVRPPQPAR